MPNLVNKMVVRELSHELQGADSLLIVSLNGLSVAEDEGLRTALAERGVRLRLVRNTLAQVALRETGYEVPEGLFEGSIAMALGDAEETIQAAKVVESSPLKKDGKLSVRGGVLEGAFLDERDASSLASVPDRDTINAMLLGVLSAPARGIASVIAATPSGLARVIQARADQAGGEDGEEPSAPVANP